MAGKTRDQNFLSQDKSLLIDRQILSYSDDTKAIYYEYEENDGMAGMAAPTSPSAHSDSQSTVKIPAAPVPTLSATVPRSANVATGATNVSANPVEDVPLSATDVVLALVAQKLKRPLDEVSVHKSLRELSGGMISSVTRM